MEHIIIAVSSLTLSAWVLYSLDEMNKK